MVHFSADVVENSTEESISVALGIAGVISLHLVLNVLLHTIPSPMSKARTWLRMSTKSKLTY